MFGINNKEVHNTNFFNFLIPFSKRTLYHKYGRHLFKELNDRGKEQVLKLSYVIYYKISLKKTLQSLRTSRNVEKSLLKLRTSNQETKMGVYLSYLSALSSSLRVVNLEYSCKDLNDFTDQ